MNRLVFLPDGTCRGFYTELIDLALLGRLTVQRASTIEFDNLNQVWWVIVPDLGPVFCSRSRRTCLIWEQAHLADQHGRRAG